MKKISTMINMKITFYLFIQVFLIAIFTTPAYGSESTYHWQRYKYSILEDGTAKIISYTYSKGDDPSLTIPEEIDGHLVTVIGEKAFLKLEKLTNITLPSHIKKIERYAFARCASLQTINLPYGLESIDEYAFYRCLDLQSIVIPDSVITIGDVAFSECYDLESVILSSNLIAINERTFEGCSSLNSVSIPGSVKRIGIAAFRSTALTEVKLHEGIGEIDDFAFEHCHFSDINIPDSLYILGKNPFLYSNLSHISMNENHSSFMLKDSLLISKEDMKIVCCLGVSTHDLNSRVEFRIPEGIQSVGEYAFSSGVEDIKSLEIPESIHTLYSTSFDGCRYDCIFIIPNSPVLIHYFEDTAQNYTVKGQVIEAVAPTFSWYYSNGTLYFYGYGTIDSSYGTPWLDFNHIERIVFDEGITAIESDAFKMIPDLTTIRFPNTLQSIALYAFSGCPNLQFIQYPDDTQCITEWIDEYNRLNMMSIVLEHLKYLLGYTIEDESEVGLISYKVLENKYQYMPEYDSYTGEFVDNFISLDPLPELDLSFYNEYDSNNNLIVKIRCLSNYTDPRSNYNNYCIPIAITAERYNTFYNNMSKSAQKKISPCYSLHNMINDDQDKLFYTESRHNHLNQGIIERNKFKKTFPTSTSNDLYILKGDIWERNLEKIAECFSEAGYTIDDYNHDLENINTLEYYKIGSETNYNFRENNNHSFTKDEMLFLMNLEDHILSNLLELTDQFFTLNNIETKLTGEYDFYGSKYMITDVSKSGSDWIYLTLKYDS